MHILWLLITAGALLMHAPSERWGKVTCVSSVGQYITGPSQMELICRSVYWGVAGTQKHRLVWFHMVSRSRCFSLKHLSSAVTLTHRWTMEIMPGSMCFWRRQITYLELHCVLGMTQHLWCVRVCRPHEGKWAQEQITTTRFCEIILHLLLWLYWQAGSYTNK